MQITKNKRTTKSRKPKPAKPTNGNGAHTQPADPPKPARFTGTAEQVSASAAQQEAAEAEPVTITTKELAILMGADVTEYGPADLLEGALEQTVRMFEILGDAVQAECPPDDHYAMVCLDAERRAKTTMAIVRRMRGLAEGVDDEDGGES
jgi:hypothetical protein